MENAKKMSKELFILNKNKLDMIINLLKKIAKSFLGLSLCWISINSTSAQEKWSLDKCITHAHQNNLTIKQKRISTEYSENVYKQSKASLLPSINAEADQRYNFGRSLDPYTNSLSENNYRSNNFNLRASMTLYNGNRLRNTIKKEEYNHLASKQEVEKTKNDISINIATEYLQILYDQSFMSIANEQLGISKQQLEITKVQVEVGKKAKGDLFEAEAQAAKDEVALIEAQNKYDLSKLRLKQLLDLDTVPNFEIEEPKFNLSPNNSTQTPSQVFENALETMPEIKSSEYRIKSSEQELSIARSGFYPQLTLSGGIYTGYSSIRKLYEATPYQKEVGQTVSGESVFTQGYLSSEKDYPFLDQLSDNASEYVALTLSIPIFNGKRTKTQVSNAKLNMIRSQTEMQIAKNQLHKNIQSSHADANAAIKKYRAAQKSATAAEEAFKYAKQKYNVGVINSVDFNVAKNNMNRAKIEMIQAKYNYILKNSILNFYAGNSLKF